MVSGIVTVVVGAGKPGNRGCPRPIHIGQRGTGLMLADRGGAARSEDTRNRREGDDRDGDSNEGEGGERERERRREE